MKVDWKMVSVLLIGWIAGMFSSHVLLSEAHALPKGPFTPMMVRESVAALKKIADNTGKISEHMRKLDARTRRTDQDSRQGSVRSRRREGIYCDVLR